MTHGASRELDPWGSMRTLGLLVVFVTVGCGASSRERSGGYDRAPQPQPVAQPPPPPAFVRLTLLGVTFGLGKVGGTQWDGNGQFSREDADLIVNALAAANAYAAVATVLLRPSIQAMEKPEPSGTARLVTTAGHGLETKLMADRDTFTPNWQGPPSWSHVATNGSVRLEVRLTDRDIQFDDPAGTFQISAADILAALQSGHVYQVRVAEQTNRQVLFAGISAMAE